LDFEWHNDVWFYLIVFDEEVSFRRPKPFDQAQHILVVEAAVAKLVGILAD
jgi:hypothetical protein